MAALKGISLIKEECSATIATTTNVAIKISFLCAPDVK